MTRESNREARARRVSVGEALGVPNAHAEGNNLDEARVLDTALAAARQLNELAASGSQSGASDGSGRRSSMALMEQTENLFAVSSGDKRKEDVVKLDDRRRERLGFRGPTGFGFGVGNFQR